jgi:ferredoxin
MRVLLCGDLDRLGHGLDLGAIKARLADRHRGADVRIVPGPCERPGRWLESGATPTDRLLLGLCSSGTPADDLHARARRLGLDPFAIEVVNLGTYCALAHAGPDATEQAALLLEAGLARGRAHRDIGPEGLKPVFCWDQKMDRRSLFTLPPLRYETVPSIREGACVAARGCRACVTTCPRDALAPSDGHRILLRKAQCTGCGACVSACPVGAIDFPGASLAQLEGQIEALLSAGAFDSSPPGILFLCARALPTLERLVRSGVRYPAGWLPVEVPCIGMVTSSWVLACLHRGAAAVGLLPCGQDDCRFGRRDVVEGHVSYCHEVLQLLGAPPEAVRLLDLADQERLAQGLASLPDRAPEPAGGASRAGPALRLDRGTAAEAVLGLTRRYGAPLDRTLVHRHSPLGVVTLREGCTTCGACVSACPTGALGLDHDTDGDGVAVSFAAALCVACTGCVPVCPEAIVQLERRTDVGLLASRKRVLHRDRQVRCERCGAPVAARALLDRMAAILGSDPVLSSVTRYCAECRGTLT